MLWISPGSQRPKMFCPQKATGRIRPYERSLHDFQLAHTHYSTCLRGNNRAVSAYRLRIITANKWKTTAWWQIGGTEGIRASFGIKGCF